MKLAYLCCPATLPGAADRHVEVDGHDQMAAALRASVISDAYGTMDEVSWDDPDADWGDYDAALIGSTWDYIGRRDAFLTQLKAIEAQVRLFNPLLFVRWNSAKTYLRDFASRGIETIPTVWLPEPTKAALEASFQAVGTEDIVLKPQVGAGAANQFRLSMRDPVPSVTEAMMAQPFIPSIQTEGEYSFIYIDNDFSHAVVKRPAGDDYRVQFHYGGQAEAYTPTTADLAAADQVMDVMENKPLIARIDMVRMPTGGLALMEAELIEPFLFPSLGTNVAEKIVAGLKRRLAGS